MIISKHTVAGTNTLSNVQIYNGGLLSGQTGATIKNVTIHSGGSMQPAAGYLSGLTVESGAFVSQALTGAISWGGQVNIASGARFKCGANAEVTNIYTDENDVLKFKNLA